MKTMYLRKTIFLVMLLMSLVTSANDYIIFSIVQNLPLDNKESIKKNFYINMGAKQGVREGTILDVLRSISRSDPYESNKRYNYRVKVGELKVIHTEENAAIGSLVSIQNESKDPLFEVENLMIGDKVAVKVTD